MSQSSVIHTPDNSVGEEARRSTRIERSVPLIIFGQNRLGEPFVERTVSTSVNLHGCRYPSRHDYGIDSWITLQVVGLEVEPKLPAVRAKVRSVHSSQSTRELQQVGVELESPANIWGITSPPQDWLRPSEASAPPAQFATGVAPALEPPAASAEPEPIEPPVKPEPKLAEVATFPSPSPAATKHQTPKPVAEAAKPQRVVVTPEGFIAAIQGKLQHEAGKAAQVAVAQQVEEAVRKALSSIEEARESSIREIQELIPARIEALKQASKPEVPDELAVRWNEQIEVYRGRVDEVAQRLEQQAAELRRELAKSQDLLGKLTSEIGPQIRARINEAATKATSEFEGAAARAARRRYDHLLENSQTVTREALLKLDVRAAEIHAVLQSAVNSALSSLEQQTEHLVDRVLSETKDRAASALSSLEAENLAACDARRQALESEVARAAERSADQFRKGMKAFLYSCLVAAVSAVDEHSKSTLDGLLKENGKNLFEAASDSSKRDGPEILPDPDIDPVTH